MQTDEVAERAKRLEDAVSVLSIAAGCVLITLEQLHLDAIAIHLEDGRRTTTGHVLRYALEVAKPINEAMEEDSPC